MFTGHVCGGSVSKGFPRGSAVGPTAKERIPFATVQCSAVSKRGLFHYGSSPKLPSYCVT